MLSVDARSRSGQRLGRGGRRLAKSTGKSAASFCLINTKEHWLPPPRTSGWREPMYCTKCGVELRENDRFCSNCGSRTAAAQPQLPHALMLDKRNKKVAGVCAGFARYLGVDVVLVRVLTLGIALCTGVGFCAYLA